MIAFALALFLQPADVSRIRCSDLPEIEKRVERSGAKKFFSEIDVEQMEDFFACVDGSDERWVRFMPVIAPGTDAAATESITISLAFALPKNPSAVLRILTLSSDDRSPFAVREVCSSPFIEDTTPENYQALAINAVKSAVGVNEDIRRACLAQLQR